MYLGGGHPLDFRPAPHNLVSKMQQEPPVEDEGGDSEEEGEYMSESGMGVYVPPRMLAVPYKDDTRKRLLANPRSRSEHHKLLSELRNEWSDLPTEVEVRSQLGQTRVY